MMQTPTAPKQQQCVTHILLGRTDTVFMMIRHCCLQLCMGLQLHLGKQQTNNDSHPADTMATTSKLCVSSAELLQGGPRHLAVQVLQDHWMCLWLSSVGFRLMYQSTHLFARLFIKIKCAFKRFHIRCVSLSCSV